MGKLGGVIGLSLWTRNAQATQDLGRAIGKRLVGGEVILLSGPLGAGKTTLVQGIAAGLGVAGRVQSPSFVLERIHQGRLVLRHLDFYRLGESEIEDAGLLDEPDNGTVTVIEWAERAGGTLDATLRITIIPVPGEPNKRSVTVLADTYSWGDKICEAAKESGLM